MTIRARRFTVEQISRSILVVRNHRVLLDQDLASLYGVTTRVLIQALRRNPGRFPADFLFQITAEEWNIGHGGRRDAPYAFTEQGVAMLSSVVGSERAIAVNVEIMRVFVRLRGLLASNHELARRCGDLEARTEGRRTAHDDAIAAILSAIRQLLNPPVHKGRGIGFTADLDKSEKQ
jgi:hypothetical protein